MGSDCTTFILVGSMQGNTSELGAQQLVTLSAADGLSPMSDVRCLLQSAPSSEADVEPELVLKAGQASQTVTVTGAADLRDDGAQQFAVSVGPCFSADSRFRFDWVLPRVAAGWNEDHAFPLVTLLEPTQSALLGEPLTLAGRHLNRETSVCVNGTYVSGDPEYRVSLTIVAESVAAAFEVTLQGAAAIDWFQNVSGSEYRPYAPAACPLLVDGRRSATLSYGVVRNATRAPSASVASAPTPLHIPGTLAINGSEYNFTAVSRIPVEPLREQVRGGVCSRGGGIAHTCAVAKRESRAVVAGRTAVASCRVVSPRRCRALHSAQALIVVCRSPSPL
jgi:hypothetical protein